MKLTDWLAGIVFLGAAGVAQAGSLDLNLSGDALYAGFATAAGNTGLEVDASILHHEEEGLPDRDIGALGVHLVDDAAQGATPFRVGVGAKLFFVDATVADGGALGIGGHVRYTLPQYNRFAIGGHAYFAPDVSSFGDTTRYLQYGVRAEYEILRQANVYLGYRRVRAEFDYGGVAGQETLTLDSGVHFGFRIFF